jgi:hypothetical protein
MDVETFRKNAKDCFELGYKRLNFTSMGGELFIHPQAIEIIKIANAVGFEYIDVYTNGILLNKFDMNDLLTSGLTSLKISFPGFDQNEYKLVYGVDKYDDFISSLLQLLETNYLSKNPINIILEPRSRISLDEIYQNNTYITLISKYVPKYVTINKPILRYDSWGGEIKQSDLPKGLKLEINPIKSIYPLKKVNLCSRLVDFAILANGDVRLCNCRYDSTIETEEDGLFIENLSNYDSIESLLLSNSQKIEKIKTDFIHGKLPKLCHGCTFYTPCKL